MNNQAQERRVDTRKTSNERLFIQIVFSNDPDLVGTTLSCKAKDVSSSGMRIECSSPIPEGCKIDIWIDVLDRPGKFFLTSDVMWSKEIDGVHCELGLELNDGSATDIAAWREVHG
ncbi:MAG: PilZ domain-containing protein [Pseudomonadales bacterium]|nr:PilZ domain-containing protein [Pseudomonadales bacterium]